MKKNINTYISFIAIMFIFFMACSKLEDKSYSTISKDVSVTFNPVEITSKYTEADAEGLLIQAYNTIANLSSMEYRFALQEHTSDEMVGPTRGTDWDDAGRWRKLSYHVWDGTTPEIVSAWNDNNSGMYDCALAMLANRKFNKKAAAAEAQVLFAYNMLMQVDFFGQVPYRDLTSSDQPELPLVYTRSEGIDEVIKNLKEALPDLKEASAQEEYGKVTKDVCRMVLAKALLNKHIFKGEASANSADMTEVAKYMNEIISSSRYSLQDNYFDNFYWDNHTSPGIIFHMVNKEGNTRGNIISRWRMGTHYNQYTSGWNGFSMIADFYDKFDKNDTRREGEYPGFSDLSGMKVGILIGQQKDREGNNVTDRSNNPLNFTRDFSNGILFANEVEGIRTSKYFPKVAVEDDGGVSPISISEQTNINDYAYFRLADAYLMYAEAILRGGTAQSFGDATKAYNTLRNVRITGNTEVSTVSLDDILDERGRELYFEGFRRQDLIRFGKFNAANSVRTTESDDYRKVFPIPFAQLAANTNLKQNEGY